MAAFNSSFYGKEIIFSWESWKLLPQINHGLKSPRKSIALDIT
jgi:hypothetical protein